MAEPKIDENWYDDDSLSIRPFLVIGIPVVLVVLAIVFSCFKGCNELGRQGKKDFYNPVETVDSGLVGNANRLLAELLADTIPDSTPVIDLESLNRKYRALTFALPYEQTGKPVIDASDLRLVGINAERIRSQKSRNFYYNSRLPKLLRDQSENLSQIFFRIRTSGEAYDYSSDCKPITIKSIEVMPTIFRVALVKDPWTGVIEGEESSLFSHSAAYITYGNTILPLPDASGPAEMHNNCIYKAVAERGAFLDRNNRQVDYYQHYRKMFRGSAEGVSHALNVELYNSDRDYTGKSFTVCISNGKLYISTNAFVQVLGTTSVRPFDRAQDSRNPIPLEDGMKIVVYAGRTEGAEMKGRNKIGEFTIYTHNPSKTLSSLLLTNVGKKRYNASRLQTDLFTQQVIRGLSSNLSNSYNLDTVRLSIDPILSQGFERELETYLHQVRRNLSGHSWQTHELYDISLTIMDMATGNILATPYYTTLFDSPGFSDTLRMTTRNPALTRRYIGSTFKPMVALASVMSSPRLLQLDTRGKYSADCNPSVKNTSAEFFGRKTYAWAKKTPSHWNGTIFPAFLAYSDDVYPVALAALAMTGRELGNECHRLPVDDGPANYFKLGGGNYLQFKDERTDRECPKDYDQPFIQWLSYLYNANVHTDYNSDTLFFRSEMLRGTDADVSRLGLDELSPDVTNLRMDRFTFGDDFRARLQPWILGQGDNQWSCIKLAEAWTRMLTKRDVHATMLKGAEVHTSLTSNELGIPTSSGRNLTSAEINSTWNTFLSHFRTAQDYAGEGMNGSNTLVSMYEAVQALDPNLVLFSKTGTPEAYSRYDIPLLGGNRRFIDLGMYTFGLMTTSQYDLVRRDDTTRAVHGLVCVVRITRSYECQSCNQCSGQCSRCSDFNGLNSRHARNFFSSHPERLQMLYDMTRKYFE